MRRKVEQEGYLQDGIKSERSSSKLQHKPCATMDHLQTQNQFYIPVQIPGYQYVSPEGNCVEHVQASSAFIQVTFYLLKSKTPKETLKHFQILIVPVCSSIKFRQKQYYLIYLF